MQKNSTIPAKLYEPIRYQTDWGTRLLLHPELFPKTNGTYDILSDDATLRCGITYDSVNDIFYNPYLERKPQFVAWSPSDIVFHGYEIDKFEKYIEDITQAKFNKNLSILKDALIKFRDRHIVANRVPLYKALEKLENRTPEEESLYKSMKDFADDKLENPNELLSTIEDAYKTLLVGNVYMLESDVYYLVTNIRGVWLTNGDARIVAECDVLSARKGSFPIARRDEETITASIDCLANAMPSVNPLSPFINQAPEALAVKSLDAMQTSFLKTIASAKESVQRMFSYKK